MALQKKTIIKWMLNAMWICIATAGIALLVAGVHKKDTTVCKGVSINITGSDKSVSFVDDSVVMKVIEMIEGGSAKGKSISTFNLGKMESTLEKNVWIRDAELYFDNNNFLQVSVKERQPIARIFTTGGNTFYLDSAMKRLPLSDEHSARLPLFTSFPSDLIVLTKADSNLLRDILTISAAISKDAFRMALIEQIDITANRNFEMIPKVGNNIIIFGDATEPEAKFERLKLFYKNIIPKAGFNYYSSINVQYKNQVVAKRRGAEDVTADSLKTVQLMQLMAAEAERLAEDSVHMFVADNINNTTDSTMIQESVERDIDSEQSNSSERPAFINPPVNPNVSEKPKPQGPVATKPATIVTVPKPATITTKPAVSKPVVKPATKPATVKPVVTKPAVKPANKPPAKPATKPNTNKPVPKATMGPKNDY